MLFPYYILLYRMTIEDNYRLIILLHYPSKIKLVNESSIWRDLLHTKIDKNT